MTLSWSFIENTSTNFIGNFSKVPVANPLAGPLGIPVGVPLEVSLCVLREIPVGVPPEISLGFPLEIPPRVQRDFFQASHREFLQNFFSNSS